MEFETKFPNVLRNHRFSDIFENGKRRTGMRRLGLREDFSMTLIKSLVLAPLFAAGMALANGVLPTPSALPALEAAAAAPSAASGSDQGAYFAPFMRFDPDAGNLDVTFGLDQAARISLQAFDTQGKLLAILLDVNEGSGFHQLSLFSNRLQGYKGHVVFQLRAGSAMLAETRLSAR
jgi:hypothetical protein